MGVWVHLAEPLFDGGGHPLWIEHPKLGPRADIVALPLTQTDDVQFYPHNPAEPGADIAVGPADAVSVVGFPFGIAAGGALAVWATGFMASEPEVNYESLPIFLIDCRSRPGQSGSPVIAHRSGGAVSLTDGSTAIYTGAVHRFLGIYSGRINTESDIGLVWKASAIAELLASI